MAGELIVVVDDNVMNSKLARVFLVSEGYTVQTATNAEEALAILKAFKPKLILMDIQLPGTDGLELTRMLKADPTKRDIIIFAFTAYAMRGDKEKALAAGCEEYVTKPVDLNNLRDLIAKYLR